MKLRREIEGIDYVCKGSISKVYYKCGKNNCICHKDENKKHGPYNLWTRKVDGKTITKSLNDNQVKKFKQYKKNYNKFKQLIKKIEKISAEILCNDK